ncbi:Uncharacterised protein [Vibrio cholerae]|nr:Uncharacterised protein [Vibrio cholerae]
MRRLSPIMLVSCLASCAWRVTGGSISSQPLSLSSPLSAKSFPV